MDLQKIDQLGELLHEFLGPDKVLIAHEIRRLTAKGENYGSTMLAIKLNIQNKGEEETMEIVGKFPPPGEFIQKMFNIPVTFRNEINFYKTIAPELQNFIQRSGNDNFVFDCFPKYYGSRLSLSNSNEWADDGAALLLENLKILGYEVVDRSVGFDLDSAKLILKNLAKFHAVPLAMKLKEPETFQKKIKPLFIPFRVFDFNEEALETMFQKNFKIVENIPSCRQYLQRVKDAFHTSLCSEQKNCLKFINEPFATLIHTDAWVNNFMVKYIEGKPSSCKIVDFQLYEYGSPARDFIFFLYSSVQISVLKESVDDLTDVYYETFLEILELFQCDITPFSKEAFDKEIRIAIEQLIFFQCMIMFEPLCATKESLKELHEYTEENLLEDRSIPESHKKKVEFLITEFVKKNYI